MKKTWQRMSNGLRQRWTHQKANQRWQGLNTAVARNSRPNTDSRPVVFFNASTRLQAMSQNAAYSLLSAMAVRLQGVPVIHFVCKSGMQRCVLGSNRDDFNSRPPCAACARQSRSVFRETDTRWLEARVYPELAQELIELSTSSLESFTYNGIPLGMWAVNSLRWMLRRHNLENDDNTRAFFRSFILSGWNVYTQFSELLKEINPRAVVLFNGMFFPEAAARHACMEQGVRVITHEVGLRPFTAFFTSGEATAYPMSIDPNFQLDSAMEEKLDGYLSTRFSGDFTMAGIRFWPEMKQLDANMLKTIETYQKFVPVFTNVIFDTSQVHANTLFENMFAWLENIKSTALSHSEILFVFRAHPDECRPGKESRESVAGWVTSSGLTQLPNVVFIDSGEYINSYELIRRAHLVMVYNSTIGLEAALLGKPVLAGGKARFTQLETAYYPASADEYKTLLDQLLTADHIDTPPVFTRNARRFLYCQLFATSLDFSDFVEEDGIWKGYVKPRNFSLEMLKPQNSTTMKTVLNGILGNGDFTLPI
ncbi:MAG TPA: hypothetical protein PKK59_09755 [Anaerolineaceae bacterium]|nr:hypothetical protein [Anaerolineaceae bacterium]